MEMSGAYGAVCNNDYINKARICLIGACEAEANCPSGNVCCKIGNAPIGGCVPEGALRQWRLPVVAVAVAAEMNVSLRATSAIAMKNVVICEGADLGLGICVQ